MQTVSSDRCQSYDWPTAQEFRRKNLWDTSRIVCAIFVDVHKFGLYYLY